MMCVYRRRQQKSYPFEQKRLIARDFCSGMTRKRIMHKYNIPPNTLKELIRTFVITTHTERYPQGQQLDFLLEPPKGFKGRVVAKGKK